MVIALSILTVDIRRKTQIEFHRTSELIGSVLHHGEVGRSERSQSPRIELGAHMRLVIQRKERSSIMFRMWRVVLGTVVLIYAAGLPAANSLQLKAI